MRRPFLVLAPALSLAAGCLSSSNFEDPYEAVLQGTWTACASDGVADAGERITFEGGSIEWTTASYPTADGSCGGAETETSRLTGTFALGEFVSATLQGARVVARGLDVTSSGRTFYTTVYVDEAATPRVLHLGVADPATGRDMTSGAKRPIVLDASPLHLR